MTDGNSVKITCSEDPVEDPHVSFNGMLQVFHFLHDNLMNVKVTDAKDSVTLMAKLRQLIFQEFCDAIIKECLAKSIPTQAKNLEQFQKVITKTEYFQMNLVKLGFMEETDTALLEYAQNVNVLFANKKCQEILDSARQLMLSEIHNTVKVRKFFPHFKTVS